MPKFIAPKNNKGFYDPDKVPEAGTHIAICYQIVFMGTFDDEYQGQPKKSTKLRLTFELPEMMRNFEDRETGVVTQKPLVISKSFSFSMSEKANLRAFLKAWRGKDFTNDEAEQFDVGVLIGQPAMLAIERAPKKDNPSEEYARIVGTVPVPKALRNQYKQFNESIMYSVTEHNPAVFAKLPEFLQKEIRESDEWKNGQFTAPSEPSTPSTPTPTATKPPATSSTPSRQAASIPPRKPSPPPAAESESYIPGDENPFNQGRGDEDCPF